MSDATVKPPLKRAGARQRSAAQKSPFSTSSSSSSSSAPPASVAWCPICATAWSTKRHWVDDKEFVELLSISQSLPGLNATNMAVLLGDRLKGWMGAIAGVVGMCLPGAVIMFVVGIFYRDQGRPCLGSRYMLKGVAAAAAGLFLSTVMQARQEVALASRFDLFFVLITVICGEPLARFGATHADLCGHCGDPLPLPAQDSEEASTSQ